jgi:ABC-type multidrug transport system fused ATPase/permease subunit
MLARCCPFFWVIFFKMFVWEFLLAGLLGIITAGLSYTGPLFIKEILNYIKNPTPKAHDQHRAYMFAGVWMAVYFLRVMFNEYTLWRCYAISLKIEQIINLVIYDKLMHMSALSRQHFEEGDFISYFVIDSRNIISFVRTFYVLFSAPTTLIMAQIFIYIEVGLYGLILSIIITVSLVMLLLLSLAIARYTLHKY